MRTFRIFDAALHGSQRPHVINHAYLGHRPRDSRCVCEIGLDDLGGRMDLGQVLTQAAAEIIEHAYPTPLSRQLRDQMGADESRTACDQRNVSHEMNTPDREVSAPHRNTRIIRYETTPGRDNGHKSVVRGP